MSVSHSVAATHSRPDRKTCCAWQRRRAGTGHRPGCATERDDQKWVRRRRFPSNPALQPCAPATTGRPAVRENKSTTWSAQRPDRTTCCASGPGRRRQPAEARKRRGGRESSGSGWAALKSTGSRRRVHRSALAARATFRPTTGRRLAPAVTAAAAVIARQHRHPQPFVSSVGLFHFSLPDLWWNIRIHSEFRE